MAFCSYFKIQPVAGGADRIKKSEWKLVSHDNSQPPRERQLLLLPLPLPLLLLLLSPDSSFLSPTASASLYLSASSIRVSNYVSVSFLGSPRTVLLSLPLTLCYSFSLYFSLSLLFLSLLRSFSPPMLICSPRDSPNLSPAQPLPLVSSSPLPSLSPSSTALNTTAIYMYGESVENIDECGALAGDINIYANSHRYIRSHVRIPRTRGRFVANPSLFPRPIARRLGSFP